MTQATMVTDLQWGSTGKGLFSGMIAEQEAPDVVMTAWTPSAGHTYIDAEGHKFTHTALANGIVSPNLRTILIGPGSVVDMAALWNEIIESHSYLRGVSILIHENAAMLTDDHRSLEQASDTRTAIGSTSKGSGTAIQQKLERDPEAVVTAGQIYGVGRAFGDAFRVMIASHDQYMAEIYGAEQILVEGAQGYSLGINSGFYPYVTSRECTPAQIASDTLLPLPMLTRIVGVARTYPIRVANRYDAEGNMVGWSGPHYDDHEEIDWVQLGMEPEYTTVTKLPRRIFTYSRKQMRQAIDQVRPTEVALNFAQYPIERQLTAIQKHIDDVSGGALRYLGWGPSVADIEDTRK